MEIDIKTKIALEKDENAISSSCSISSSRSIHTISQIHPKGQVWIRSISSRQSLWNLNHRFLKKHCSQLLLFYEITKKSQYDKRQIELYKTNSIRTSTKILSSTVNKPLQKRPRKNLLARRCKPQLYSKPTWLKPLVEEIIPKTLIPWQPITLSHQQQDPKTEKIDK